jgi:hypothetical protein
MPVERVRDFCDIVGPGLGERREGQSAKIATKGENAPRRPHFKTRRTPNHRVRNHRTYVAFQNRRKRLPRDRSRSNAASVSMWKVYKPFCVWLGNLLQGSV